MSANLVSIHSVEEHQFLNDLIVAEVDSREALCQMPHQVWIGLRFVNGTRSWSDESSDDYVPRDQPINLYYTPSVDTFARKKRTERRTAFITLQMNLTRPTHQLADEIQNAVVNAAYQSHCSIDWNYFAATHSCYYFQT
ncbi:unnamed protein product, partial [Mesorhabditis belari]|uniref:Uncharacterized protein n=1 Tax=Mesorhabditis belari TaxID=2138241 RepID=A0AAF3FL45_9BILA